MQSTVMCQQCGNKSLTFESFLDLSLSIDSTAAATRNCKAADSAESQPTTPYVLFQ